MSTPSGYHERNVERAARAVFGDGEFARAMELLGRAPGAGPEPRARLQVAALKLSGGELAKLAEAVEAALVDWRDVLAWAEYPGTLAAGPGLAEEERRSVAEGDLAQYVAWLESVGLRDVRPIG